MLKENQDEDVHITCFIDNNKNRQGGFYEKKPVIAPQELSTLEIDYVVIASDKYYTDIYRQLTMEVQWPKEKILNFDQFLVLVKL